MKTSHGSIGCCRAAQLRLLIHILGILNAALLLAAAMPGGLVQLPIALAVEILIRTANAIIERLNLPEE